MKPKSHNMKNKKGVILAGGLGTRMMPLTSITNKHLLPVYDQQMIMFPLKTLISSGIRDILIITDKKFIGDFSKLLGNGKKLGVSLSYGTQKNPKGGIADALKSAKDFVKKEEFAVILGDNIFEDTLNFQLEGGKLAKVFLKEVANPDGFGVAQIEKGRLVKIFEKPKEFVSNLAALGAYVYSPDVFDVIKKIKPSQRGEMEITDINNYYAQKDKLCYQKINGFWADAGTFDGLFESSKWRKSKVKNK